MKKQRMQLKYIALMFALVAAFLGLTMTGLADGESAGTSGGLSVASPSAFSSRALGSITNDNNIQLIQNVEVAIRLGATGTEITSLEEVPESNFDQLQYYFRNCIKVDTKSMGTDKVDISNLKIIYPIQLTPDQTAINNFIGTKTWMSSGPATLVTATGSDNTTTYPAWQLDISLGSVTNPVTVTPNPTGQDTEDFLKALFFTLAPGATLGDLPPEYSMIQIEPMGEGVTHYEDADGYIHVYQRVLMSDIIANNPEYSTEIYESDDLSGNLYDTTNLQRVVTWVDAYNYAKELQPPTGFVSTHPGYLATITSAEEQNMIYTKIATNMGWLAGTRMLAKDSGGITSRISDEPSLEKFKTPGGTLIDSAHAFPANYETQYVDNPTTGGTGAFQWYWADGPEAGKTFYGRPKAPSNGLVPYVAYNPTQNSDHAWNATDQAYNVDYGYNIFDNPANTGSAPGATNAGVQEEPNDAFFGRLNPSDPTTVYGEYCLQFAYTGEFWNDYNPNYTRGMTAVYVEWGGYPGDSTSFNNTTSGEIPQPITTTFALNWNAKEATTTTTSTGAPKPHYFFGAIAGKPATNGGSGTAAAVSQPSYFVTNTTTYVPIPAKFGALQDHFEIKLDVLPTMNLPISDKRQQIPFVYWGVEYSLDYYPNGGQFPGSNPDGPISMTSRYMEYLPELPTAQNPTKHSSAFDGGTIGTNSSPDGDLSTISKIIFDQTNPSANRHTTAGKMEAYTVWARTHWDLYFDGNGGQLNSPATLQIPLTPGTRTATTDISTCMPGGADQPTWFANAFLGWKNSGNVAGYDTESTPAQLTMTGDVYLTAAWLDLADYVSNLMKDTVIYKNEATAEEIYASSNLYPTYQDLLGNTHSIPLTITSFDETTISGGGVTSITVALNDPITGGAITLPKDFVDLYSLNRPYLDGNDTYYMFVGEPIPSGNNFNVYLYIETPNFANRSIDRAHVSLDDLQGYIDANLVGKYPGYFDTLFKDYFGNNISLEWPVVTIVREPAGRTNVREPAGRTKEEKRQVEASEFWVITTEIYHQMKPGQIIEVTESNYKDGGRLLDETIPEGVAYDRQIRVTPGIFYYMNPCILDRIKDDEAGRMDVYLPGRSLTFNSWDFDTDPTISDDVKFDPRSYFDLRMSAVKNEKITALVGADTMQMQVYFEMNRPWYAEAQFGLTVNDTLKAAADSGKTLYLFNYNENTNELELVGPMTNQGNGYFSTQMNGVYHNYVILAGLPEKGNYRLTEQTNTMDSGTVREVTTNLKDSGKAVTEGEELSGISTTTKFLNEDKTQTNALTSTTKISTKTILLTSIIGIGVIAGGVVVYLKKRH